MPMPSHTQNNHQQQLCHLKNALNPQTQSFLYVTNKSSKTNILSFIKYASDAFITLDTKLVLDKPQFIPFQSLPYRPWKSSGTNHQMSHKIKFLQKLDKNLSLCLHLFFCTVYKHWKLTVLKLPTAARYCLLGDHRQPKACLALVLMVRKRLQSPCSSNSHSFTVPSREADAKLKLPS